MAKKALEKAKINVTAKVTANAAGPQVGDLVPDFSASATSGEKFKLSNHSGKKVVLYFYPKDSTPGCTIEGHQFSELLPQFKKCKTVVYGISRDSLKSHEKFKEKQCFDFELLSDEDEKICVLFDIIKEKNMYGKTVMGIERSTYVLDDKGKILALWRKVKADGHAEEVLDAIKAMKNIK